VKIKLTIVVDALCAADGSFSLDSVRYANLWRPVIYQFHVVG
jgi:hypothetical protein